MLHNVSNPSPSTHDVLQSTEVHPSAGAISAADKENLRLGNDFLRSGMDLAAVDGSTHSESNGTVTASSNKLVRGKAW